MKILIDTNVVLDILLHRQPWYSNAVFIFSLAKRRFYKGYVSASAITDIFYIAKKRLGKTAARQAIRQLLTVFSPATVTDKNIYQALNLEWNDFEDSVQFIVGKYLPVDFIITRNIQDFASASINAITPEQFIQTFTDIEK